MLLFEGETGATKFSQNVPDVAQDRASLAFIILCEGLRIELETAMYRGHLVCKEISVQNR